MASITAWAKKVWKDRKTEYPTRRTLTKTDGSQEIVTVARNEGSVSQEGDAFSAENMNDLEERIDAGFTEVNGNLTASDNAPFRFGVNENGEYGYIVTDSEGADSVIPFKTDNLTLVAKNYSYQGTGTSCSYTCTKNCKIGVFGTAFSSGTNGSYGGSHVYVNGAEQSISRIAVESDATRGVFFTVINAKKGDVILVKAGINSGNNYLHSIAIFATE